MYVLKCVKHLTRNTGKKEFKESCKESVVDVLWSGNSTSAKERGAYQERAGYLTKIIVLQTQESSKMV